jgi:hypothetical protein
VWDTELGRDPRGDGHGPVDSRRDHAVDPLGAGEALDPALVLGGDDCPAVGEGEPGRRGVAIDRDREEPPPLGRLQQPELRGTRP